MKRITFYLDPGLFYLHFCFFGEERTASHIIRHVYNISYLESEYSTVHTFLKRSTELTCPSPLAYYICGQSSST